MLRNYYSISLLAFIDNISCKTAGVSNTVEGL